MNFLQLLIPFSLRFFGGQGQPFFVLEYLHILDNTSTGKI